MVLRQARRAPHEPAAVDPDGLRLLPLLRELRDAVRPAAPDEPVADAVVRAGRRRMGRQARGRPRSGGGEGRGQPRRRYLAVRRAVRAGRRQARARPAPLRRARHRQDDAREGDRDGLQLAVHLDAGLGLCRDLHRDRRDHRPHPRPQGQAARPQVGRPVHRLHRRDRRRRDAAPVARNRARRPTSPSRARSTSTISRFFGPWAAREPVRRPDRRDAGLARAALRAAADLVLGAERPLRADGADHQLVHVPRRHGRRHGRRARAQPAPRRDGRHRQPAVLPPPYHEHRQQDPRRALHRPAADREDAAADPGRPAAERADLLHRRHERADRPARSRR